MLTQVLPEVTYSMYGLTFLEGIWLCISMYSAFTSGLSNVFGGTR